MVFSVILEVVTKLSSVRDLCGFILSIFRTRDKLLSASCNYASNSVNKSNSFELWMEVKKNIRKIMKSLDFNWLSRKSWDSKLHDISSSSMYSLQIGRSDAIWNGKKCLLALSFHGNFGALVCNSSFNAVDECFIPLCILCFFIRSDTRMLDHSYIFVHYNKLDVCVSNVLAYMAGHARKRIGHGTYIYIQ